MQITTLFLSFFRQNVAYFKKKLYLCAISRAERNETSSDNSTGGL